MNWQRVEDAGKEKSFLRPVLVNSEATAPPEKSDNPSGSQGILKKKVEFDFGGAWSSKTELNDFLTELTKNDSNRKLFKNLHLSTDGRLFDPKTGLTALLLEKRSQKKLS